MWPTAKAVGDPVLVNDQARVSGRQKFCAPSDISVAPTGLAHDAYALSHGFHHGPHSAAAARLPGVAQTFHFMSAAPVRGRAGPRLVQIAQQPTGPDARLRRLLCGKALPFRRMGTSDDLLHPGWQAEPSSLGGGKRGRRTVRIGGAFPQSGAAKPLVPPPEALNLDRLAQALPRHALRA